MARLHYKHRGASDNIIIKVTPAGEIPTKPIDWEFGGVRWKDKSEGDKGQWRYKPDSARKVLRVKHYINSLRVDPNSDGGEHQTFLIDVPKHFFDSEGNFTATPAYDAGDILHVLWTGGMSFGSGWIDLNYQERGGNGGSTANTEVGCAKWS